MRGMIAFLGFAATVPLANWMIGNVGSCAAGRPCVIPVGFGLYAPSGVLMVCLALVFRDAVHMALGWRMAAAAVTVGAIASGFLAPTSLVIASVFALLISEMLDLAVFAQLRLWSIPAAILASGLIGAAADSAVFLLIAFGSLDFLAGQVVGKIYASIAVAGFFYLRDLKAEMGRR